MATVSPPLLVFGRAEWISLFPPSLCFKKVTPHETNLINLVGMSLFQTSSLTRATCSIQNLHLPKPDNTPKPSQRMAILALTPTTG